MAAPARTRLPLTVETLEDRSLLSATYVSPYTLVPLNPNWTQDIGNLTTTDGLLYQVETNTLPPASYANPSGWYDASNYKGPYDPAFYIQGQSWGPQPYLTTSPDLADFNVPRDPASAMAFFQQRLVATETALIGTPYQHHHNALWNPEEVVLLDAASTSGSTTLTLQGEANAGQLSVGMGVSGPGIPVNTTVQAIDGSSVTLSAAAGAGAGAGTFLFSGELVSFQGSVSKDGTTLTLTAGDISQLSPGMIVSGLGLPNSTPTVANTKIVSVDVGSNTIQLSTEATATVTDGTFFAARWPWEAVSSNATSTQYVLHQDGDNWVPKVGTQFPNPYPVYAANTPGIDCSDTSALAYNVATGIYLNSDVGQQALNDGSVYQGTAPIGWNLTGAPLAIDPGNSEAQGLTLIQPQFLSLSDNFVYANGENYINGYNAPGSLDPIISQLLPGDLLYVTAGTGAGTGVVHVVMWLGQYAQLNGVQVPLVISSHDNTPAVLDANGNMPPPGVYVLPFVPDSWFYQNFCFAMRLVDTQSVGSWLNAQPTPPTPASPFSPMIPTLLTVVTPISGYVSALRTAESGLRAALHRLRGGAGQASLARELAADQRLLTRLAGLIARAHHTLAQRRKYLQTLASQGLDSPEALAGFQTAVRQLRRTIAQAGQLATAARSQLPRPD